ncbi:MAG: DNA repair protein RadA [Candidatus Nitrohelix vancouverensis]|uniref:DNA repair protein RadA n=1 Tax=Candidatus Nitrohelix vancouverensis TaxID=2705534 RepID=A0A7T0G248_9BACT|nr:MAG: DNA repair protein RadA [Candidatus Nitrohelix vancouverensis]
MAKATSIFVCQNCGHQSSKWMGKCPGCEGWNSLAEESAPSKTTKARPMHGGPAKGVMALSEIQAVDVVRAPTGIGELDRVLGGGLTPGSLTLIGGDPGIGKSTLLLQCLAGFASQGKKALYISGEESPTQIKQRAERLGAVSDNFLVCSEICIEDVLNLLDKVKPDVMVFDSIQTFYTNELSSAPGSIGQVRETAFRILQYIKAHSIPGFLVGHITKDGAISGPKSLEHIVDTVIYFEGERGAGYRVLRAVKNRFGPTPELGVFEMRDGGLREVDNPSEIFLSERRADSPGSVIVSSLEGSRPLLVEVQALAAASNSIGMPRRMGTGFDQNRLALLIAIMEKKLGLALQGEDIFINIVGGFRLSEPAGDLGVAAAIAGSFRNHLGLPKTAVMGEVGLTGEVRPVNQLETRLAEAEKLGFENCVVPFSSRNEKSERKTALKIYPVKTLEEAFDILFET